MDEWEKYEMHHRSRLAFKPGLTGMWQVSGRSNITDFEEVVRLDTEYTLTYINVVSLLVLPLAALIFVFSKEIVQILFGRGAFNENTVLFVSRALKIYALGIVGASFRDVLNKVFYSMKDTKTPMINGTIAVAVNIELNILLVKKFEYLGLAL